MSHSAQESPGLGLREVFDILVEAPPQRLLSLTFQLGESPEDNIIHALSLIVLQKEARALNRLQMLEDNCLANHLAEKWQMSKGSLKDFAIHCGNFQFTGESLALLARIFKVLSEQKLCDPHLRDLAYKRALSSDISRSSSVEDLEYSQLREEAKEVCGPQLAEWMCSSKDLKSGSYNDAFSRLDEGITTLKVSPDQSDRAHSLPSPLQTTSLMCSYPTHLEISIPPTAVYQDDETAPETSQPESKLSTPVGPVGECGATHSLGQSHTSQPQPKSGQSSMSGAKIHSRMDEALAAEGSELNSLTAQKEGLKQTAEPSFALPTAANTFLPTMTDPNQLHESEDTEEEDEARFYAFVILHAPDDADMAESMKERLEKVIDCEGATFSADFEIPGKSTLDCLTDAIRNSAFTVLLLTRNFNTDRQNMETDCALINSLNNKYKKNTVIPLLPRDNCMPRQSIPMVLQTLSLLVDNKHFEKRIPLCLTPAKIKQQKEFWTREQRIKKETERQERLKHLNQHQKQLIKECKAAEELEEEKRRLSMERRRLLGLTAPPGQDSVPPQQQPQTIRIENAKYIMIGDGSRMNVCGVQEKEDSGYVEEEQ